MKNLDDLYATYRSLPLPLSENVFHRRQIMQFIAAFGVDALFANRSELPDGIPTVWVQKKSLFGIEQVAEGFGEAIGGERETMFLGNEKSISEKVQADDF